MHTLVLASNSDPAVSCTHFVSIPQTCAIDSGAEAGSGRRAHSNASIELEITSANCGEDLLAA